MTDTSELENIHDLDLGDIVHVPIEDQSKKRRLIVDDRSSKRENTIPLLGENGGEYHLEQTGEIIHLNYYSESNDQWVGQGWFKLNEIDVGPDSSLNEEKNRTVPPKSSEVPPSEDELIDLPSSVYGCFSDRTVQVQGKVELPPVVVEHLELNGKILDVYVSTREYNISVTDVDIGENPRYRFTVPAKKRDLYGVEKGDTVDLYIRNATTPIS
jgi:hypothetical protein